MGCAGGVLALITPVLTTTLFNNVIPTGDRGKLVLVALALLVSALVSALFQITQSVAILRLENRMDAALQAALWDRLLKLPVRFFRQYTAGDLAARALGISAIRQTLTGTTTAALLGVIFALFSFGLLFAYNASLALVATLLVLVIVGVTSFAGYLQIRQQRPLLAVQGQLSGTVLQFLTGIAKLRVAGAEERAFAIWARGFREQKRLAFIARGIANKLAVFNAASPVVTTLVIYAAVAWARPRSISAGTFLGFNAAFAQFLTAMLSMSAAAMAVLTIVPTYERLRPILQALPEDAAGKADPGQLRGGIEVGHVSFRYQPDGPLVLKDVSLQARAGEFVAIVGPSGSGKSTLLRLLLGFETPEAGSIYYDGQSLAGLNVQAVRRQIGVVLQNGKLMPGPIYKTIIGTSLLTLDDAWEAARLAGLKRDIERLPMGMHTVISEGGSTLSGGQRQRLMIARAVAGKPRVLLFDEATSALDSVTQDMVSTSLESLQATRIVIAHRLSTIMNADRIYVMVAGSVVQSGTYRELVDQPGPFADLVKRQLA
jgi:ATP-binding cassette subfamily C protein